MNPTTVMKIKKWSYLLFWATVLPLLPFTANAGSDGTQNYWAWFIYFFVFGIVPILDFIVGKDPTNPDEETEVPSLREEKIYRIFTLIMAPLWFGTLYYSSWAFANKDYIWFGKLACIDSIGRVGGIIAIKLGRK